MTRKLYIIAIVLLVTAVFRHQTATAAPRANDAAWMFTLNDIKGTPWNLKEHGDHPMIILYFFDATSRSSLDGLIMLNTLKKKYKEADLTVWGITASAPSSVHTFIKDHAPVFPILMDIDAKVSEMYDAKLILPTCFPGWRNENSCKMKPRWPQPSVARWKNGIQPIMPTLP